MCIRDRFEGRGLLDISTHITLLDRAAGHHDLLAKTEEGWQQWDIARKAFEACLLYTSDAADDLTRVDLGGRRISWAIATGW